MNTLMNPAQAAEIIRSGRPLLLAGDEELLRALPRGSWIGGTIPYFMTPEGGALDRDRVFVTELPDFVTGAVVRSYAEDTLPRIPKDYPDNGVSFVILPAFSGAHSRYARECQSWPELFLRPLVGWVAGVALADLGKTTPKVFDGATGEVFEDRAVVMHASLPEGRYAKVDIANIFTQGSGEAITFDEAGFQARRCRVDGVEKNLAAWLREREVSTKLPLVADYSGAMVNVSIQDAGAESGLVSFYAPVFPGHEYRVARPVGDYAEAFRAVLGDRHVSPAFTCNCILNFLYGELQGKRTGELVGPITFGEIGYVLLNQTMVYLTFESA